MRPFACAGKSNEFKEQLNIFHRQRDIKKSRKTDSKSPHSANRFCVLPASVSKIIQIFHDVFDKALLPKIIRAKKRKHQMSAIENQLFYLGLLNFGFTDIASVRAFYLPTFSIQELKTRILRMKRRQCLVESSKIKVCQVI
jgi:hypothetical protein